MFQNVIVRRPCKALVEGITSNPQLGKPNYELALCTIFFPEQMAIAYPMALALGNLVDPPATMVNAAGDYVVSYIVARFVDGKDWLQKALAKKA